MVRSYSFRGLRDSLRWSSFRVGGKLSNVLRGVAVLPSLPSPPSRLTGRDIQGGKIPTPAPSITELNGVELWPGARPRAREGSLIRAFARAGRAWEGAEECDTLCAESSVM